MLKNVTEEACSEHLAASILPSTQRSVSAVFRLQHISAITHKRNVVRNRNMAKMND